MSAELMSQLGLSAAFLFLLIALWKAYQGREKEHREDLKSIITRYESLLEHNTEALVSLTKDLEKELDNG